MTTSKSVHLGCIFLSTTLALIASIGLLTSIFGTDHIEMWQIISSSVGIVMSIICFFYAVITRILSVAEIESSRKKNDIQSADNEDDPLSFDSGLGVFGFCPHVISIAKWLDARIVT